MLASLDKNKKTTNPHPIIDNSLCVGCGVCVKKCAQGNVIEIINRIAVVTSPANCVECGVCSSVCPKNAIKLSNFSLNEGNNSFNDKPKKEITLVNFKYLSNKSPVANKQEPKKKKDILKPYPVVNENLCVGCGLCTKKCQIGDILKIVNKKAHIISKEKCVGCGICANVCPKKAIILNGNRGIFPMDTNKKSSNINKVRRTG